MIYLQDADFTLHQGDALDVLRDLPSESVDCCITSPPYGDARSDIGGVPEAEFAAWAEGWLVELLRIVRGSLLLNLGRVFRNYQESDLPYATRDAARKVGWEHAETVLWHKPNALPLSGPYLVPRHEYVWWLAKDAKTCYRGIDDTRQPHSPESIARYGRNGYIGQRKGDGEDRARLVRPLNESGARAGSVFTCYIGTEKGNPHPAPMPSALAEFLVLLASRAGDTILDPFMGSGTTALAARKHGRRCVGIELNPAYCEMITRRTQQLSLLADEGATIAP